MAQAQRTVLQIINAVQQELGLQVSSTVIGNPDLTTVQLFSVLNLALEELRDVNDTGWDTLQTEFNLVVNIPVETTGDTTLNTAVITNIPSTAGLTAFNWAVTGTNVPQGARILSVDSGTQVTLTMECIGTSVGESVVFAQDTYAMPTDFGYYQSDTWWDRTNRWQLLGPDSAQLDQFHRSGVVQTGPRRHFRNLGPYANNYRIWPPPADLTEPLQLVFEYISLNAVSVQGSQTNFASSFANDSDQPVLDARALIMSVKWRFFEQKGLSYASKRDEYDRWVDRLMARDGGSTTLSYTGRIYSELISPFNVQDGYYPSGE